MRRKTLRRMSTQQPPLGSECARSLFHTAILTKLNRLGISRCEACGGNKTFAPFAFQPLLAGSGVGDCRLAGK